MPKLKRDITLIKNPIFLTANQIIYSSAPIFLPKYLIPSSIWSLAQILSDISCTQDKDIDCGYSLEPPRWSGSNEYPESMFWAELWKTSEFFYLIFFQFWEVKFSIYLNRRVFLMGHLEAWNRRKKYKKKRRSGVIKSIRVLNGLGDAFHAH